MKCQECKFCKKDRFYTADSFEHEYNWSCTNPFGLGHGQDSRIIENYVSWNEENRVETPSWCFFNNSVVRKITEFTDEELIVELKRRGIK
jgi:hypothetical protein